MEQQARDFIEKVRLQLEAPALKKKYIGFNEFPHGSCGDASELLGYLLDKHGLGKYELVFGENSKGATHAWLENENELVDITGDQFSLENDHVIIKTRKERVRQHLGFKTLRSRPIIVKDVFMSGYVSVLVAIEKNLGLI